MSSIPKIIYNDLENSFGYKYFMYGKEFKKNNIKLIKTVKTDKNITTFHFKIESMYYYEDFKVEIKKDDNEKMLYSKCDCSTFRIHNKCEHIVAVLYNYYDLFYELDKFKLNASKEIIKRYSNTRNTSNIKKELKLEVNLEVVEEYSYYNYYGYEKQLKVKLKLGENKLYSLTDRKLKDILESMDSYKDVYIGKSFTYSPSKYYFNKEDEEIINYFQNRYNNDEKLTVINNSDGFFKLLENRKFTTEYGTFNGIRIGFPIDTNLVKKGNLYTLTFNKDNVIDYLDNQKYLIKDNIFYKTDKKTQNLLTSLNDAELDELEFEEDDLKDFSSGLLPILKENLKVSDNLKDKIIIDKPIIKLYFDLYKDLVTCKIILNYMNNEIDYFNKDNTNILRDIVVENEVINDLLNIGFIVDNEKNKIILDDIDKIVEFLETNILELSEKYETFTSEKLKKVSIVNNNKFRSTFSLGQDNILHYNFDLGIVNDDELDNILSSMKRNKKYYKLKNGDILNLENNELKELNNLIEDMDIDTESNGEIPKYRAIYLDSLKNKKYNIIETDNLFDNFINKFNKYKDSNIEFTKDELNILRDYQVVGVKWLYNIHKCDLGGILADEMGLGKSIQVIYLIKKLLKEDKNAKFLIVVPTALVYNWENEFKKFAPEIKYQICANNKDMRHKLIMDDKKSVYITSYGLLREDIEYYEDKMFTICIIDEAQNIKNPNAGITKTVKRIKSMTRLALTGTPIENAIIELWSIFDFLMPGFLSNQTKFLSKYKVKDINDDESNNIGILSKLIAPFILRRKKKDVIKDLPEKINNNIYIELSDVEKKLYASLVKDTQKEMDKLIEENGYLKAKFMILILLTKLRQLCIDPKLVFNDKNLPSSKMENLIKVIKEVIENGHKILLFTSFKTALDIVRTNLNKEKISNYTIDGSVSSKKRIELVDKFNNDDTKVFLIMLKSGGTGLNLTSADVVIHLDLWWNPQAENQATDRSHRIGQKNTVEVIKLITKGTIEEKILDLQEKKKLLSDKLIEGDNRDQNILESLTEKDMRDLLAFDNED